MRRGKRVQAIDVAFRRVLTVVMPGHLARLVAREMVAFLKACSMEVEIKIFPRASMKWLSSSSTVQSTPHVCVTLVSTLSVAQFHVRKQGWPLAWLGNQSYSSLVSVALRY